MIFTESSSPQTIFEPLSIRQTQNLSLGITRNAAKCASEGSPWGCGRLHEAAKRGPSRRPCLLAAIQCSQRALLWEDGFGTMRYIFWRLQIHDSYMAVLHPRSMLEDARTPPKASPFPACISSRCLSGRSAQASPGQVLTCWDGMRYLTTPALIRIDHPSVPWSCTAVSYAMYCMAECRCTQETAFSHALSLDPILQHAEHYRDRSSSEIA